MLNLNVLNDFNDLNDLKTLTPTFNLSPLLLNPLTF